MAKLLLMLITIPWSYLGNPESWRLRQMAAGGVVAVLGHLRHRHHDQDVGVCAGGDAHAHPCSAALHLPAARASHHGPPHPAVHPSALHKMGSHYLDEGPIIF